MAQKTFHDDNAVKVLASNSSSNITFAGTKVFSTAERVVYLFVAHASINLTVFKVQIASDAAGTGAADAGTTITSATAGQMQTIEITPGILETAKQYVGPVVTVAAGTYTLLEIKKRLRNATPTQDATYPTAVFNQ